VINVAGGRRVSLNELLAAIAELCGVTVAARHEPARAGDVRDSLADLGRARELLRYEPAVPLRQGLLRTIESLRKVEGGAPR
jgi:nucleoside-diphosphate-sugar epimerase